MLRGGKTVTKQHRPWLPTAIMAGVAVLLLAFSIWLAPRLSEILPKDGDQAEPIVFFDFTAEDIVQISVTQGFLRTIVERVGATEWRIVSPTADMADSVRLNDLALRIAGMRSTRALEDVDASSFGMSEGAAQVSLELADGTTKLLSIGDENPGGTFRYVQLATDSRIHLVSIDYVNGLLDLVSNPPYPPTPLPPPSPVETPAAEGDESLTPEAVESPTSQSTQVPTAEPTEAPTPTP
jgi:hypothetical protein